MNFREQLSEAYKNGYNQGLQELYAGAHEGAHEEEEGYHEGAHEEDEGYHEEMDEKALAELGRMMIRAGMHEMDHEEDEGMHEGEHEEQLDVVPLFSRDFRGTPIDPNVQAPIGFSRRRDPGSGRR